MRAALRIAGALLLAAGVLLTGRALYLEAKAHVASILIRRAWLQTLQSGEAPAPWPWADTRPVARLQIPRLGYEEIVLEGATPRTLAFGPARLASGAALGEPGNIVFAGHRTSWFRGLQGIAVGDSVLVEWLASPRGGARERSYLVTLVSVVEPDDLTLLGDTEDTLTLITCYPFGNSPTSPQRFLVRAAPLGASRGAVDQSPNGGNRRRP